VQRDSSRPILDTMEYIVIFDVATKSHPWYVHVPCSFVFLSAIYTLLRARQGKPGGLFKRRQPRHVALIAVLSAGIMAFWAYSYEAHRRTLMDALEQGRVSTVEGVATVNPDSTTFFVGDHQFCASGDSRHLSPAYSGPPLRLPPNSWVRVSHLNGHVLRVELVAKR
jgi:hypothetical protein